MVEKIFEVKTLFPVYADIDGNERTTTKRVVEVLEASPEDVVNLYNSYLEGDYKVSISFIPPAKQEQKENADHADDNSKEAVITPFDVGKALDKQGIPYRATLKIKDKGDYEDMIKVIHLVEADGFNLNVSVTLKINEDSLINLDVPGTWTERENAIFKVSPKAHTNKVEELKSLYEAINRAGYEAKIDITPKAPEANNMDDDNDTFANQLSAYPSHTLVKFSLRNNAD